MKDWIINVNISKKLFKMFPCKRNSVKVKLLPVKQLFAKQTLMPKCEALGIAWQMVVGQSY